jgi:hypothetical protein
VVSSTPLPFRPRVNSPLGPLHMSLGGPTAGVDDIEELTFLALAGLELPLLGRPSRRLSSYGLCSDGP